MQRLDLFQFIPSRNNTTRGEALVVGGSVNSPELRHLKENTYSIENVDPLHTFETIENKVLPPNTYYDVVIAMHSLQFVPVAQFKEVIEKLLASLKQDGILVVRIVVETTSSHEDPRTGGLEHADIFTDTLTGIVPLLSARYWTTDRPHAGMPYEHQHLMFDYVGVKR